MVKMTGKRADRVIIDDPRPAATNEEILAALTRIKVLFQARTIAAIIGAPMPDPADFKGDSK